MIVSILDEQPTGFVLGASAYLSKPVARQELLDTLQRVAAGVGGERGPVRRVLVDDQPDALELIALVLDGSRPELRQRARRGWVVLTDTMYVVRGPGGERQVCRPCVERVQ